MKHLVVTECLGSIPISKSDYNDCLSSDEADELALYVRNQSLDEEGVVISRHEVVFINYVGFIQLQTCSIEILPKVSGDDYSRSRRVLLRMLQHSGFLEVQESQVGQLTTDKLNLYEILAYLLTDKVSRELRRGIYRTYQREESELQLIRGKIDMNRQLRREAMMQAGVSCVYDEFQVSNPLNQVLKAALLLVMSRCRFSETKKRAAGCLALMDEVILAPADQLKQVKVCFDRTNRRFESSYRIAKLLLNRSAPTSATGNSKNSSILFKMNDLYEAYIAYLVCKNWERVKIQDRSYKLLVKEGSAKGVFQLEPDLLVVNQSGQSVIIDTKWKMIHSNRHRHGVKREDFYQMYAYLTRYQKVQDVILLYPHHDGIDFSGECLETWHLEGEPGKRLQVFSINYEDELAAEMELSRMIK